MTGKSAMEQMVEWLKSDEAKSIASYTMLRTRALEKAIEFLNMDQAQKPPTDMAGMVEDAVNKFLGWKLPKDFSPDGGIFFGPFAGQKYDSPSWPSGTNLLNAEQAKQMFQHCLGRYVRPTSGQEGKATVSEEGLKELEDWITSILSQLPTTEILNPRRANTEYVAYGNMKLKIQEIRSRHPSTDKCGDHFVEVNKLVKRLRERIEKKSYCDYEDETHTPVIPVYEITKILDEFEKEGR